MHRRGFVAAVLAAAVVAPVRAARGARYERGLLWEVSRPGGRPNHVFGTMHVAHPRLDALPRGVQRVLERAASLQVEFHGSQAAGADFLDAAQLPTGERLDALLGEEDFARACERLAVLGWSAEFVRGLKPWAVLINLRTRARHPGPSLDERLLAGARARRLPVEVLESLAEQIFTFDEFPLVSQIALLRHALAHEAELETMAEQTMQAYLDEDLATIWRIQRAYASGGSSVQPHSEAFFKRVVLDRSVVMAFRMQRELRRGRALVAVGALHLYGPQGVLALLAQDGYRVRRRDPA